MTAVSRVCHEDITRLNSLEAGTKSKDGVTDQRWRVCVRDRVFRKRQQEGLFLLVSLAQQLAFIRVSGFIVSMHYMCVPGR